MTVQRMVGAPALVAAMRRGGQSKTRGAAEEAARQRPVAARRSVPTVSARPNDRTPGGRAALRVTAAE